MKDSSQIMVQFNVGILLWGAGWEGGGVIFLRGEMKQDICRRMAPFHDSSPILA